MELRKYLAKLRTIKWRVKILYEKYPDLRLSDQELTESYSQKYHITLSQCQLESVTRAGRYWRAKQGFKRQRATETEQCFIHTFAKS